MALASGIEMSQSRLIEENGNCHFMTKRFDRTSDGEKIHTLTLCGMAHLDYKKRETNSYESFFDTMVALNLPSSDFQEGFRRMVFNALAANCDDHTGNISFLMDKDGIWRLAPAYDLTFSYNPTGKWTHQHLMSINGKWKDFNRRDFICIANRYGVDDPESIIQQVYHAVTGWYDLGSQAGLSPIHIQRIEKAIMDRRGLLSI
jgi:serine/threonine-protein kinase HipA